MSAVSDRINFSHDSLSFLSHQNFSSAVEKAQQVQAEKSSDDSVQQQVTNCLAALTADPGLLAKLASVDINGEISVYALNYIADLSVKDGTAAEWGGVEDKNVRQAAQTAARLLLGRGKPEEKPVADWFRAAMLEQDGSTTISQDEIEKIIADPQ